MYGCECCGKEFNEPSFRCNNCGVNHRNKKALMVIRDYVENHSIIEQNIGLNYMMLNLFQDENFKFEKAVEIGTWLGASARVFANHFNHLICVDHWHGDKNTPEVFMGCKFNLRKKDNIDFFRMLSKDASKKFDDETFDFIYIDADHRPECVKEDIECWLPKLKKGGYIAGHDYGRGNETGVFDFRGLTKVVDEKFGKENIIKFVDTSWLVKK